MREERGRGMGSNKVLSSAEAAVLCRLADQPGGVWAVESRALWENRYWTLRLLNRLVGAGLVEEVEVDARYKITNLGHLEANRY